MSMLENSPHKSPAVTSSTRHRQRLVGGAAVLGSALLFYLATAIIHWSHAFVTIGTSMYTFSRFVLGFIVVSLSMVLGGRSPRCNHLGFILSRMLTNTIAVFCFYKAVEVGSVAEANILNMTYPLFVALLSWFLLKHQRDIFSLVIVGCASIGIWLILAPDMSTLHLNDFWGLLSGFFAGFAILSLNLSRQHDDAQTILWYMFGLGAVLMLPMVYHQLRLPSALEFFFLFACSMAGVGGQYLLTYGFRFVTAVEGAVVSSSRILIAALLGPLLVADAPLSLAGMCGACIIFSADIVLALRSPKG